MRRLFVCAVVLLCVTGCLPPDTLSYPSPQTLRVGVVANITPVVKGVTGSTATFKVSPALPKGLTLNTSTGVISGTPTQESAQASYLIRASNLLGSTTATLVLAVLPVPPSKLQYPSPQVLAVGDSITLSPTVVGSVNSYSVSPALPVGIALDSATGVVSGTATTESQLAVYTITAANAGGSSAFDLSISVAAVTQGPRDLKFYTEVDTPQAFGFESETRDSFTFFGRKDATGRMVRSTAFAIDTAAGKRSGFDTDELGRPMRARLDDGSRIDFEWQSDTLVRATATSADGVMNATIELDLTQPPELAARAVGNSQSVGSLVARGVTTKSLTGPSLQQMGEPGEPVPAQAQVRVTVTSFGEPVSDAEVVIGARRCFRTAVDRWL